MSIHKRECELIFSVTEKCNLACDYCYIDQKPKVMSRDVIDYVYNNKQLFFDRYQTDNYRATYFGGEPMMNWELLEYAMPKFAADKDCFSQLLVTNGLLLDEQKIEFLRSIRKLYVTISFDGLWNETNRPLCGGESSLDLYMDKKDLINSIAEHTRVMVQPNCVDTLTENFIFLTESYGQPNCQWWLVRDDIWSKDDITKYDNELIRLTNKNIDYYNNGVDAMCGLLLNPILDMHRAETYGKRGYSCVSGCYGLSFSTDGYGYPCTRFATNKRYPIFDIKEGKFIEDNFNIFSIRNEKNCPAGTEQCKKCSLYQSCSRGCKHEELVDDDGEVYFKPLDSICDLYHIGYRESIRLLNELKDNELFKSRIRAELRKRNIL